MMEIKPMTALAQWLHSISSLWRISQSQISTRLLLHRLNAQIVLYYIFMWRVRFVVCSWRKENLWLVGKIQAVVLMDLCLCFKRTQIFSREIILHTLNIYCTSSQSDLCIFTFCPQLCPHIVWYRYTNMFCTKYTTTIGVKMWACQFFDLCPMK